MELRATSQNSGGALLLLVLAPARVLELAASLWPPLVLVLVLAASPSKRPRAPVQALAASLWPPLVLPLAFAPARALLQGPC